MRAPEPGCSRAAGASLGPSPPSVSARPRSPADQSIINKPINQSIRDQYFYNSMRGNPRHLCSLAKKQQLWAGNSLRVHDHRPINEPINKSIRDQYSRIRSGLRVRTCSSRALRSLSLSTSPTRWSLSPVRFAAVVSRLRRCVSRPAF